MDHSAPKTSGNHTVLRSESVLTPLPKVLKYRYYWWQSLVAHVRDTWLEKKVSWGLRAETKDKGVQCGEGYVHDARERKWNKGSLLFYFPFQPGFWFALGFTVCVCACVFLFALLHCHFEEVEREHHEPPADQPWSQAAGQPQSPSEAPVTGLPSYWKPQNTCTEYCNPHTLCSVSPKRNKKESLKPQIQNGGPSKSQGIPRPALKMEGGAQNGGGE